MRPNPKESAGLVTFTEEILSGKLNFLCSETHIDCAYKKSFTYEESKM